MIFPSLKDKQRSFQDECNKQDTQAGKAGANSIYVKRAELEKIVEQETKKRNPEGYWSYAYFYF